MNNENTNNNNKNKTLVNCENKQGNKAVLAIGFKKLNKNATIPAKAHPNDSGFDLASSEDLIVRPGETTVVLTGLSVSLPEGFEATIRPRSGITLRTKIRVQLGTIDNGYRGELKVILDNINPYDESLTTPFVQNLTNDDENAKDFGEEGEVPVGSYVIRKGDRIAQLVIQPIPSVVSYEVESSFPKTDRGGSGFGGSGLDSFF